MLLRVQSAVRPAAVRLAAVLTVLGPSLAGAPLAAQQPFTLEEVLSAPFPSGLVAAPAGGAVAWVHNQEGVRNIWVASPPDYAGRRLTAYTNDDGQALGILRFTPAGRRIVFLRGGGPNRQGEIPNPTSDPEGSEQAIWIVDVTGEAAGRPRRLAIGSSPAPSPDGERVAFLRQGQVWTVPLAASDSGAAPSASRLFRMRGRATSLRWSPDGTRLAFVSQRGDHAFVGVYERASGNLRFLDPSLDRDGAPAWSPDGTRLAFLRFPADRDRLPFAPQREALPWSIRVVELASGSAREVWRAEPGPGSAFRGVEAASPLLWAAGDRLVFPWERQGWTHLYSIPAAGGAVTPLTPGAFEVEHVALTPDRTTVVYSSNQDDIDRRHLWRVPVAGGTPRLLTPGRGIEWSPAVTSGGEIAFLASDARTPAHAALLRAGERRPLAPAAIPERFPTEALVEPRPVVFAATDGMEIHGQLFVPPDLAPGERRPAVLFFHGGSRRQMLLGWHYRGYYHNAYALNQYLASRGYLVLSVNYRSGTGYGMEFREALDYGARGASEFRDVLGAGEYLRGRPDVDAARIGLWGGSYGGYLTALGLARASDVFAAGVDVHGVHDWNVVIRNFVPAYQPEARAEVARLAFESSPMASLDGWRSPVLLVHGDDDRNVPFSESVDLAGELRRRGVEVEQLVFPDEVHSFLLHRRWLAAYRATAAFFDRHLGRGSAAAEDESEIGRVEDMGARPRPEDRASALGTVSAGRPW